MCAAGRFGGGAEEKHRVAAVRAAGGAADGRRIGIQNGAVQRRLAVRHRAVRVRDGLPTLAEGVQGRRPALFALPSVARKSVGQRRHRPAGRRPRLAAPQAQTLQAAHVARSTHVPQADGAQA